MLPLFRNPGRWSCCYTRFIEDALIKRWCNSEIKSCRFLQIPIWHLDISWLGALFIMPQTTSYASICPPTPAWLQDSKKVFLSWWWHDTTSPLYLHVRAWWPKGSNDWVEQDGHLLSPNMSIPSHHFKAVWNSAVSRWRLRPGEGINDSQEAASFGSLEN